MKEKDLNLSFDTAFGISNTVLGRVMDIGIFLDTAMKELKEAHDAVKEEGWKEVNAALVLLEHAKKEHDRLDKEFNTLHNFLDRETLNHKIKEHPNV